VIFWWCFLVDLWLDAGGNVVAEGHFQALKNTPTF
jgi:hypothetical protein